MKKLVLWLYDEDGDASYSWNKFEDVSDIWQCIGWLCNLSHTQIKITYLEYYNTIFDNFENYVKRIKEKNSIVAKLEFNNHKYMVKLEEEDR